MLRPAHRGRGGNRDYLAGDQPVEEMPDRGQMLFRRRLRHRLLQALDVGRDVYRFDIDEAADLMLVAPVEKLRDSPCIGQPRITVADRGREKLDEASRRLVAGSRDHARQGDLAIGSERNTGGGTMTCWLMSHRWGHGPATGGGCA